MRSTHICSPQNRIRFGISFVGFAWDCYILKLKLLSQRKESVRYSLGNKIKLDPTTTEVFYLNWVLMSPQSGTKMFP